jgi:hypothetical protein
MSVFNIGGHEAARILSKLVSPNLEEVLSTTKNLQTQITDAREKV